MRVGDEERLRRFEREARTLASLDTLTSPASATSTRRLALELVPGEDLKARLSRGPLDVDEAIDVCPAPLRILPAPPRKD